MQLDPEHMTVATTTPAADATVYFPRNDGSRVAFGIYSSQEIYDREQERIFRGPTWNFVALEAEIPLPGDYKSSFVGDTPVVVSRNPDMSVSVWVNRCAHRGAKVCRSARGNAKTHVCVYHQWSYATNGDLVGVPFRRGVPGIPGMPADFDQKKNGMQQLRAESYKGLVFASFSETVGSLFDYLGPEMQRGIDRIFHKPIVYLGCTRQYSKSNWKLYSENVRDGYHATLLHSFHSTFNLVRAGSHVEQSSDWMHNWGLMLKTEDASGGAAYKEGGVTSFKSGLSLEDETVVKNIQEYDKLVTNHIQTIFPQLIVMQIQNSLAVRQLLPKGPKNFELIFHYFGYEDDTPEMRHHRIKQVNLVGPSGLISMEDTEATELIQTGTAADSGAFSMIDMGRGLPENTPSTMMSERSIRRFWQGYQELMGL